VLGNDRNHWSDDFALRLFTIASGLVYAAILSPIWGVALLVYYYDRPASPTLEGSLIWIVVICTLVAWWHGRKTAKLMVDEQKSFRHAFTEIYYSVLGKLSLLPLIGGLAERLLDRKSYTNPYLSEDEGATTDTDGDGASDHDE
jgi:hypothetical protein